MCFNFVMADDTGIKGRQRSAGFAAVVPPGNVSALLAHSVQSRVTCALELTLHAWCYKLWADK